MPEAAELCLDVKAVKERREKLGLTMDSAAEAAGFGGGRQQWYNIESGRRVDVPISTLGRIARALKCRPQDLLTAKAG